MGLDNYSSAEYTQICVYAIFTFSEIILHDRFLFGSFDLTKYSVSLAVETKLV